MAWIAAVLVPVVIAAWIWGHFLRQRRAARQSVLRRGVAANAEVVSVKGHEIGYRFEVPGWKQPIVASSRAPAGRSYEVGQTIPVRYLPAHPHISAVEDP